MIDAYVCEDSVDSNGSNGSISACKGCSGFVCCGIVSEGGAIEPPFLTRYDIEKIEYHSGLHSEQFVKRRINTATGNMISTMKTSRTGCIFFDVGEGKCQIYSFRPMDCRLFPLDIEKIGASYYWAMFKYDKCAPKKIDTASLLSYSNEALRILADELNEYASYPVPGMAKVGYKIIGRIKTSLKNGSFYNR